MLDFHFRMLKWDVKLRQDTPEFLTANLFSVHVIVLQYHYIDLS